MSKTLAELSREYDLALIEGAQFRRLLALAHAEGQLSAILQAAGINLWHLAASEMPANPLRHAIGEINRLRGLQRKMELTNQRLRQVLADHQMESVEGAS